MERLPSRLFRQFPRHADPLNSEETARLADDPVQQRYVSWLQENGVIAPRVAYPCVFGEGLVGVAAREDIPPQTAIMFIPFEACLSLNHALKTELRGVFALYPELFKYHKDALDYMFFLTLLYERFKGAESAWAPLLDTIPAPEMALDWSLEELQATHDPLLIHEARQMQFDLAKKWLEVKEVVEAHPDVFGVHSDLKEQFVWAYKVVYTRTFDVGHPKGMLIPLAVNLNHDEFDMSYLEKTKEWLLDPSQEEKKTIDFSDFDGVRQRVISGEIKTRQFKGKLVKYIMQNPEGGQLASVRTIEEVDPLLKGFVSSSGEEEDDDEAAEVSDSDESEPVPSHFVVVTGKRCFYPRNSQVFTRYGREGNRSLLLNFAFVLRENQHDCLKVRLWDSGFESQSHTGKFPTAHFSKQMKENATLYKIRKDKLCEELIMYNRKKVIEDLRQQPGIGELRHLFHTVPTDEFIELQTLRRTMVLLKTVESSRFTSSVDDDKRLLQTSLPLRLRFAVRYRLSQQRIMRNQLRLVALLISLFQRICAGEDYAEVTKTEGDINRIVELYPLKVFLKKFRTEKEWRTSGQFVAAGLT